MKKTPKQIADTQKAEQDKARREELDRKRKKVREELYPFLVKNFNNIDETKVFLQVLALSLQQEYLRGMNQIRIRDMKMGSYVNEKADNAEKYKEVFDMFQEETLSGALEMIEGFPKEIDTQLRLETKERKLETIKLNLL